jgi:hypothetical protein
MDQILEKLLLANKMGSCMILKKYKQFYLACWKSFVVRIRSVRRTIVPYLSPIKKFIFQYFNIYA